MLIEQKAAYVLSVSYIGALPDHVYRYSMAICAGQQSRVSVWNAGQDIRATDSLMQKYDWLNRQERNMLYGPRWHQEAPVSN